MHFADILNSQLIYTVILLLERIKKSSYTDILISESMVSFSDSLFEFSLLPPSRFIDPLVLVFGMVKLLHPVCPKLDLSECSGGGGTELCWKFQAETAFETDL